MFISVKKYYQIIKAIATLANRPYLQAIRENTDGTVVLEFVQGDKTYQFIVGDPEIEERILN